jgi:hypothetical protein
VQDLVERGYDVAVKYHPRQIETDYLDVGRDPRVSLLPSGLPLEYVYILAAAPATDSALSRRSGAAAKADARPLQMVIGDVSTTLLTARWLVPDARVISLARPLGLLDPAIEELFAKLAISVPPRLEPTC